MPLLRFDVIEGRDEKSLQLLLDTAHQAMVEAFGVPERDRYQIVHQHPANELIIQDTGLGFQRTKDLVIISMTSKARTESQKEKLYALLAERLEEKCGSHQYRSIQQYEKPGSPFRFGLNANWKLTLAENIKFC